VTLLKWVRNNGDYVERDEVIAELESEKATFEVNAEQAGILKTSAQEGDTLKIGDVVAQIDETAAKPQGAPPPMETEHQRKNRKKKLHNRSHNIRLFM
jgi:2-oxoglutarate dehydrogenase E2 component (dihydrolipoamide succinyltransferase)